ncbi:hypothetical protein LJR034_003072 [Caballeronia sp. LjRoot34]|uniref:hypothetical protein n=1 Tax=Caballeronia sp. LjRoot34 TaxID=3342325 RepID=UPI003ED0BF35
MLAAQSRRAFFPRADISPNGMRFVLNTREAVPVAGIHLQRLSAKRRNDLLKARKHQREYTCNKTIGRVKSLGLKVSNVQRCSKDTMARADEAWNI